MIANLEAELGAIACCIIGGTKKTLEAIQLLPKNAFTSPDAEEAWNVLELLVQQETNIDLVTFAMEWPKLVKGKMPESITTAIDALPSAENLPYYVEILHDCAKRRRLQMSADVIRRAALDIRKPIDSAIAEANEMLLGEVPRGNKTRDGKGSAIELYDYLEETWGLNQQGKRSGVETGLSMFDHLTDGLQYGELSIIGARPSIGKTTLGLNMMMHACLIGEVPSAFISLEMSRRSLLRRACSAFTQIPARVLKTGEYANDMLKREAIRRFGDRISKARIFFNDAVGHSVLDVTSEMRRLAKTEGVRLFVVDFLQKIAPSVKHEKRTYEVAEVSTALQKCARDLKAVVIVLAQLNRDNEKEKQGRPPRLSDLADSGQIERDGDLIALLHRSRNSKGIHEAELYLVKQRDGETGLITLEFEPAIQQFRTPRDPSK